ncbi:uncharacterized protein T551_00796 [Pneumocystis jirovecii RU7]|uniref:Uncharacterized protein n=1 Tax=Pneumocystis jirovecii (strain RU7) TaxID=1408657 RepID=A0A0W4ZUP9_PNEJ7|nr:uncharacterized protein T551_00796 [Pneumocystis jirovecii RU7]KTW32114.1 hypothetical protein T551_00796 [Pneumocystis jirovecii RU7]
MSDSKKDLPSGILYINNALALRGLLPDGNQRILNFNSSDSHEVIKIIYDLLEKRDKDLIIHENSLEKLKEIQSQNEKYSRQLNNMKSKLEETEKEVISLKKKLDYTNKELSTALIEKKSAKDYISKIKNSLIYIKSQYANDLRKKDLQLSKLKEYLLGSELSKKNKNSSTMQIQTNSILHKGPLYTPSLAIEDLTINEKLSEEAFSNLIFLSRKVSNTNIQLNNIIFQVLSDLDYLIGTKVDQEPLFSSSTLSPIILEAQLQVRLKLLSDIIFQSNNNTPLSETQTKDQEIYFLKQEIQKFNNSWTNTKEFLNNFQKSIFENKNTPIEEWEENQINARNISNKNISHIFQKQKEDSINDYQLLLMEQNNKIEFSNNSKTIVHANTSFEKENALQQELEEVLGLLPKTPVQK